MLHVFCPLKNAFLMLFQLFCFVLVSKRFKGFSSDYFSPLSLDFFFLLLPVKVQLAAYFFFFFDPPGDPGKNILSSIHFRLCTSFCPSAERRLGVNLAPSV